MTSPRCHPLQQGRAADKLQLMTSTATLLSQLITIAHDGSPAAFCKRHGVQQRQSVSNILNGTGNSRLSFKKLEKYAKADGYTIGTVLHPHSGNHVADALAHVRAAAVEAKLLEYQKDLTQEQREQLALLDEIIKTLISPAN